VVPLVKLSTVGSRASALAAAHICTIHCHSRAIRGIYKRFNGKLFRDCHEYVINGEIQTTSLSDSILARPILSV